MFFVYVIEEKIDVSAGEMNLITQNKGYIDIIYSKMEEKYVGKILDNEGLCVCIFNISLKDSFLHPHDANIQTIAIVEVVIFKPILNEILIGDIIHSNKEGILVSLGFANAFIPEFLLLNFSLYDEMEKIWIWRYEDHDLFYDIGEKIRFKVSNIMFSSTFEDKHYFKIEEDPQGKKIINSLKKGETVQGEKRIPYQILGKCQQEGLGLLNWWSD